MRDSTGVALGTSGNPLYVSGGGSGSTGVAQGSTTSGQTGTLTQGAVVSGDQAYTVGTTQPYNLTTTGRLKVGLSSAGNVAPAAKLTTTTTADLAGCIYRAGGATFADQYTGSLACDAAGNLNINNATLSPGAATAANQPNRDGNNDLRVQTVTITQTSVSVPATTSTQLVAANSARIGLEIQCDGTAIVGIGRQGATLTSAAGAGLVIPSGSYPLYTMPYASKTAVTAYTATAQTCRVTEYAQQ